MENAGEDARKNTLRIGWKATREPSILRLVAYGWAAVGGVGNVNAGPGICLEALFDVATNLLGISNEKHVQSFTLGYGGVVGPGEHITDIA